MCSCLLTGYAVFVYKRLVIRLNLVNRTKWLLTLAAIVMRLALSILELITSQYGESTLKYYYLFVLDQINFMIILSLFFNVIGSW